MFRLFLSWNLQDKESKVNLVEVYYRPRLFQEFEAPRFLENWHMKVVTFSPLLQEISLEFISVRG